MKGKRPDESSDESESDDDEQAAPGRRAPPKKLVPKPGVQPGKGKDEEKVAYDPITKVAMVLRIPRASVDDPRPDLFEIEFSRTVSDILKDANIKVKPSCVTVKGYREGSLLIDYEVECHASEAEAVSAALVAAQAALVR